MTPEGVSKCTKMYQPHYKISMKIHEDSIRSPQKNLQARNGFTNSSLFSQSCCAIASLRHGTSTTGKSLAGPLHHWPSGTWRTSGESLSQTRPWAAWEITGKNCGFSWKKWRFEGEGMEVFKGNHGSIGKNEGENPRLIRHVNGKNIRKCPMFDDTISILKPSHFWVPLMILGTKAKAEIRWSGWYQ